MPGAQLKKESQQIKYPTNIDEILRAGVDRGCSDVHIATGAPPKARVYGSLEVLPFTETKTDEARKLLFPLMDAYARTELESKGQWDMAYTIPNVARFRVNIFQQKRALSAVFRVLNTNVVDSNQLGLPMSFFELTKKRRGLVLVTGVTGSGKSTTLASFVDVINQNMFKHIITLEEPIEYLHWHARSNVSQREIGSDVNTFADGLRAALREDPDIILVGEMRDEETMQTALLAAETGHLVLSTLHTMGAAETMDRVVDTFPEKQHRQVRSQLASTIEAIMSQQLLPKKDGTGYVVAYEILYKSRTLQDLIREGNSSKIEDYMRTPEAKQDGNCIMDDCIFNLYRRGVVSADTALSYSIDRKYMESLVNSLR